MDMEEKASRLRVKLEVAQLKHLQAPLVQTDVNEGRALSRLERKGNDRLKAVRARTSCWRWSSAS